MKKQGLELITNRKSPLTTIEENDKSFKRTGPGKGTVIVRKHEAEVRVEPGDCLSLWMTTGHLPACQKLSHLGLVETHHAIPGLCMFARPHNNGVVLLSEISIGKPQETAPAFHAAKRALEMGVTLASSGRVKLRMEVLEPSESDPRIQQTLDEIPYEVAPRGHGWAMSVDTAAQFQRIHIAAVRCDGVQFVHIEAPCERMVKPKGNAAKAVGAFLLETNARMRLARFSLKPDDEKGYVRPVVESVIPAALFSPARASETLRRILAGATRVRQELSLLGRGDMACVYISG